MKRMSPKRIIAAGRRASRINRLSFRAVLHLVFFLSGIATVLIGQVLPILTARFALTDLQAGYLFPAQFAGSLFGTILTDRFARRGKLGVAAIIGTFAMASGLLLMNLGSFEFCLVGFGVNGIGIGLTLPAINILILEMSPANPASALSILNFFWGAGAIVSKPFVDLTAGTTDIVRTTAILASLLVVFAVLLLITDSEPEQALSSENDPKDSETPVWSLPLAWLIALFNFIHVGFESGMGGWLTSYAGRFEDAAAFGLFSPTLLYFLFFVAGRATAPILLRRLNEDQMLFLSLGFILVGTLVMLGAGSIGLLSLGAVVTGFGTSAVFPTNVSRFSRVFGAGAMRRAMPLFICGTLGATTVTYLIGFVSDRTGSLRSGMGVLLGSILSLIVLQFVLAFRSRSSSARP